MNSCWYLFLADSNGDVVFVFKALVCIFRSDNCIGEVLSFADLSFFKVSWRLNLGGSPLLWRSLAHLLGF